MISVSVGLLAACGDLFEVENPSNILDEELESDELIAALANTPQGALSLSYSDAVVSAGLVSDEVCYVASRIFPLEIHRGQMDGWNENYENIYNNMSSGQWIADDATRRLEEKVDASETDSRVGEAYFWTGIFRLTLADLFEESVFDGGVPITPIETIKDGIARLEKSVQISTSAGNDEYRAAALGAIARAYRALYFEELHEGSGADSLLFQEAEEHARRALDTKATYQVDLGYEPPGSSNNAYSSFSTGVVASRMDPRYANRTDPVSGTRDLRISHGPLVASDFDGSGKDIYIQLKYEGFGSDIPISRWQEAALIIAEHRYMRSDYTGANKYINIVRNAADLPDFESTDPDKIWAQLMYERETEFWLELRRWQDHRYYEIVPDDWTPANQSLGVHRRWPISVREKDTNPQYSG